MRARLAISSARITVELREILLRDKAAEFLTISPKGTVPVLQADVLIEESLDVMAWALDQSDPEGLMQNMTPELYALIAECDGPFKTALDKTKYAVRHPDANPLESRAAAATFIAKLDAMLTRSWLTGDQPCMADFAILPFVRQFAHTNLSWWDDQTYKNAQRWLVDFKTSGRFARVMTKYPPWKPDQDVVLFP